MNGRMQVQCGVVRDHGRTKIVNYREKISKENPKANFKSSLKVKRSYFLMDSPFCWQDFSYGCTTWSPLTNWEVGEKQ